jgi:hypothetical protein
LRTGDEERERRGTTQPAEPDLAAPGLAGPEPPEPNLAEADPAEAEPIAPEPTGTGVDATMRRTMSAITGALSWW